MREDDGIGRYVTPETVRLGLTGLGYGSAVGLAWRALGRTRWGAVPFVLAVLGAARHAHRSDWFSWDPAVTVGFGIAGLAGAGAARLIADPAVRRPWIGVGGLCAAAGVWAGVPETGPALLVGGALTGLIVIAAVLRVDWAPVAGAGMAAVIAWAALSGASGRTWAALGGVLCTGLAPWFAVRPLLPSPSWALRPGPWLLASHVALVICAARWIGVVPDAGWQRVALVGSAGLLVAVATRSRA